MLNLTNRLAALVRVVVTGAELVVAELGVGVELVVPDVGVELVVAEVPDKTQILSKNAKNKNPDLPVAVVVEAVVAVLAGAVAPEVESVLAGAGVIITQEFPLDALLKQLEQLK